MYLPFNHTVREGAFFNIKQNPHNIQTTSNQYSKNYTGHRHDMVHKPAKLRENTALRFQVPM